MENGVTIINPENTYIEDGVKIGRDSIIYPGAIIKGRYGYRRRLYNWRKF